VLRMSLDHAESRRGGMKRGKFWENGATNAGQLIERQAGKSSSKASEYAARNARETRAKGSPWRKSTRVGEFVLKKKTAVMCRRTRYGNQEMVLVWNDNAGLKSPKKKARSA